MSKGYFTIFVILLAIPVLISVIALTYFCFKISLLAGFVSLGSCILVINFAIVIIALKIKSNRK